MHFFPAKSSKCKNFFILVHKINTHLKFYTFYFVCIFYLFIPEYKNITLLELWRLLHQPTIALLAGSGKPTPFPDVQTLFKMCSSHTGFVAVTMSEDFIDSIRCHEKIILIFFPFFSLFFVFFIILKRIAGGMKCSYIIWEFFCER